jgi:hypothetical protein
MFQNHKIVAMKKMWNVARWSKKLLTPGLDQV